MTDDPGATPLAAKSTTDEIRARFDADVERFSNLDTGQSATIDAPLAMELITQAAAATAGVAAPVPDLEVTRKGLGGKVLDLRSAIATGRS